MKTSITTLSCPLLLLLLLSLLLLSFQQPSAALDFDDDVDSVDNGGMLSEDEWLAASLGATVKRNAGRFPFRYGKRSSVKRHLPFRYGKRTYGMPSSSFLSSLSSPSLSSSSSLEGLMKRQFRYGKRSVGPDPAAFFRYSNPQSASAYNQLSSMTEDQ